MRSKLDAIVELASRYDYDAAHAHQVECLAGTIFMELEPLHQLGRDDRKLLEYAAIVHDIGYFLTSAGHHKHTMQLLMIEPLEEFSRSEKLIIANVARYHRKALPSNKHTPFAILTEREQRRVELLAPILRLADGLDKTHRRVVKELACNIGDDDVQFHIAAAGDATQEMEALLVRGEMFRIVYGKEISISVAAQDTALEEAIA